MTYQIPEDCSPEQRELLEEVLSYPDIFHISEAGMVSLVDPEAARKEPGVDKALRLLERRDRILFTLVAEMDSEWFLKPTVDWAIQLWNEYRHKIMDLYSECQNHEEMLEWFMERMVQDLDSGIRPAKLLFDVQTVIKNQIDFAIVDKQEDESGLVVVTNYPGLSYKEKNESGYAHMIVAIIYFEGDLDQILYGDDPVQMREQIDRMYNNEYGRGPDKLILARRT